MRAALILLAAAAIAAPAHKPFKLPDTPGTRQEFAAPYEKVRPAVDAVFNDFAKLGWAVREENDSVHASRKRPTVVLAMHAYLIAGGQRKTVVNVVYESHNMPAGQRRKFEAAILKMVEKRLKGAVSPKAP